MFNANLLTYYKGSEFQPEIKCMKGKKYAKYRGSIPSNNDNHSNKKK